MNSRRTFFRRTTLSGLALSFILLFATTTLARNPFVSVLKDGTNIRTNPSDNGTIHMEVFADFPLKVIEQKDDWSRVVDFEGDGGWVQSKLLSPRKTVIITKKLVSLWEEPNSEPNNQVVVTAKHGVTFRPIADRGDWLQVRYEDGTEAWVEDHQVWPPKPFDFNGDKKPVIKPAKAQNPSHHKAPKKLHPTKTKKSKIHHK